MNVFIILPSMRLDSPIMGAIALANGIDSKHKVNIICLKKTSNDSIEKLSIAKNISIHHLDNGQSWYRRLEQYKIILKSADKKNISISVGFSADLFNYFVKKIAITVSSVRGNLVTPWFI